MDNSNQYSNIDIKKLPESISSIEEFRQILNEYGINEDDVRFYLGKYFLSPKAYGIYEEDGLFKVYKVKANGDTSYRYTGPDEKEAVNELYKKFLSEISKRKGLNKAYNPYYDPNYTAERVDKKEVKKIKPIHIFIIVIIAFILIDIGIYFYNKNNPKPQYYQKDDHYYYHDRNNDWYYYDTYDDDWIIFYPEIDEYNDYYEIENPEYYYYDDYDYDNGYDYDYDDDNWSSDFDDYDFSSDGFSDWDSDW